MLKTADSMVLGSDPASPTKAWEAAESLCNTLQIREASGFIVPNGAKEFWISRGKNSRDLTGQQQIIKLVNKPSLSAAEFILKKINYSSSIQLSCQSGKVFI